MEEEREGEETNLGFSSRSNPLGFRTGDEGKKRKASPRLRITTGRVFSSLSLSCLDFDPGMDQDTPRVEQLHLYGGRRGGMRDYRQIRR